MPNWCNGTLKIKGSKEQVKLFFIESIEKIEMSLEEENWIAYFKPSDNFYVKGTYRNIISNIDIDYVDELNICISASYVAAWFFAIKKLKELSQKYSIEFRINATDPLANFTQIEIKNGEILKNDFKPNLDKEDFFLEINN